MYSLRFNMLLYGRPHNIRKLLAENNITGDVLVYYIEGSNRDYLGIHITKAMFMLLVLKYGIRRHDFEARNNVYWNGWRLMFGLSSIILYTKHQQALS